MATQYDSELKKLKDEEKNLEDSIKSSSTFYGGGEKPTQSDLFKEIQQRELQQKISNVRDDRIAERWFPERDVDSQSGGDAGVFGKTLDALGMPVYGVVGAVEHLLGTGSGSSVMESVNKNMQEGHRTFGDVLSQAGAPSAVSAPLGFSLDVAFDPANWVTAGTTAIIPRVTAGLLKPGAKGAARAGLKSSALGKATTVGKFVPGVKKTDTYKKMVEESMDSTETYNKLMGFDPVKKATENRGVGIGSDYRISLRDLFEKASRVMPGESSLSRRFYEALDYNNPKWMRLARIKDSLEESFADIGGQAELKKTLENISEGKDARKSFMNASKAFRDYIDDIGEGTGREVVLGSKAEEATELIPNLGKKGANAKEKTEEVLQKISEGTRDASDILHDADGVFKTGDPVENAFRIAMETRNEAITLDDLKALKDAGVFDETGIKAYDNLVRKIKNFKMGKIKMRGKEIEANGEKILDAYSTFISLFKRGKVGGSPSAWTNAIVGNPIMALMAGINIADPLYASEVKNAFNIIRGGSGAEKAISRMENSPMAEYMKKHGKEFARVFGVSPEFLGTRKELRQKIAQTARDIGLLNKGDDADRFVTEAVERLEKTMDDLIKQNKDLKTPTPGSITQEKLGQLGVTKYDLPGSLVAEIMGDARMSNELFEKLAQAAKEDGRPFAKLWDAVFNKALSGYEKIDQTNKLANTMHLVMNGIKESELVKLSRSTDFGVEDIIPTRTADGFRFKIAPEKAAEISNEIYLNYQAMPAAIRMLRQMPILGSPFSSFMYGMTLKTGSTAAYNPAAFNKVNFALQEFGGEKTPLERKALESKYYNYLDDPAMLRLPFWEENPVYLNMANMLPYYSLNMFSPNERPYQDSLPSKFIEAIDKTPLLDDPVGQTLFDYMILPMIIQESQPIGSFGQPIYPKDASIGEKALLAGRNVADAAIPGALGFAGAAVPSDYANLLPGYHTRKLSRAMEGKTSYGTTSDEPKSSRVLRALSGMSGLPVQSPVNLQYTAKEVKEGKKK